MLQEKKGQNLVEVVLIIPLLLVIILGILEYALFQRNISAVQDMATEAAIAASKYYVAEGAPTYDLSTPANLTANLASENAAVDAALNVIKRRGNALGLTATIEHNDLGPAFGERPFALYQFDSQETTDYKGNTVPKVTFTVDYRDPVREGISTQLIYYYNLVLFGMEFSIPGVNAGRKIVIIPRNVQISSTQTRQYVNY